MADSSVRNIIEKVFHESLESHLTALKKDVIERCCKELEKSTLANVASATPTTASSETLNAAFCSVVDSSSQAEILSAFLDGASRFAARVALFVIRAGIASGWRSKGFQDEEAVKSLTIDLEGDLARRAFRERSPASGPAAHFDSHFLTVVGAPAVDHEVLILPLVVREKVAALIYADAGTQGASSFDAYALECLARFASLWLEVIASRKSGIPAPIAEPAPERASSRAVAAAQAVISPVPSVPAPAVVAAVVATESQATASSMPLGWTAPAAVEIAPEDEEVHRKARRFAKLLVDEIKLYNQAKVAEGREHRDVYQRLRDDIDKSRATYEKRYGQTAAAAANYFHQELVRILCDNDPALLGVEDSR